MSEHQQLEYKRVYEDQIRFCNDGQLPEGWTIARLLQKHTSKPYNPLIAGAFFRSGDIESWGRGIDKIREACTKSGIDYPSFEFAETDLMVEFRAKLPTEERDEKDGGAIGGAIGGVIGGVIDLTDRQSEVVEFIKSNTKISYKAIAEVLCVNDSAIDKHIKILKEKGVIQRVGGTRGHWEVRQ